jgi:hypothetical protein
VYQQQQQQQQEQEQEQDAENPFLDPPFSRIKKELAPPSGWLISIPWNGAKKYETKTL